MEREGRVRKVKGHLSVILEKSYKQVKCEEASLARQRRGR